jgi:NAD(P)-dependent dehydrogenase (short-subunit alcohol dehydrogenase family)
MHSDEVHVVTGANRGLGRAIAEGLARDGATVLLACRSPERGAEARAQVREAAGHDRVHFLPCDLVEPGSVQAFAQEVQRRFGRVDVLVNNAGLTPVEHALSPLGVELGWHASYLGHYQLTRLLLPTLQRSAPARVVNLAGLYQRRGTLVLDDLAWEARDWDWGQAGADTQLARVVFTIELARRLHGTGVTANAVHPGAVRTHAQDALPAHLRLLANTVMRIAFVSPPRGARTVLRLAEDPDLAEVSGRWYRRYHPAEPNPLALDPVAGLALWERSAALLAMGAE